MDWPSIIASVTGGLVLLAVTTGIAVAKWMVKGVCEQLAGIRVDAAAAKQVATETQRISTERFAAINERLDELHTDVRELRRIRQAEGR